jgi:hypothetical protein
MLFDLIKQRLIANVKAGGSELPVPITALKRLLNFFTLGIVLEAANQRFKVAIGTIGFVALFNFPNPNATPLSLQFFDGDAFIF